MADNLPKLTYFDIHGKAEPMRMCLQMAGAQFTNNTVNHQEFAAMKEAGTVPSGQLPLYEDA